MNSAAALKAFCGERGGIVCTSSNAARVLVGVRAGREVLFFPDEHLGRNTGVKNGIPTTRWSSGIRSCRSAATPSRPCAAPPHPLEGLLLRPRPLLGRADRGGAAEHPGIKVIVHPECRLEVVQAADRRRLDRVHHRHHHGGARRAAWAVGTEINLVNRLNAEHPDKQVFCLDPVICPCSTMYRVHPAYLAWVLEELVEGRVLNEITVSDGVKASARLALDRMLALPGRSAEPAVARR